MTINRQEQLICSFKGGQNGAQSFFHELIKEALKRKFGNLIVRVNGVALTEAIFNLTDHDTLEIYNKKVNGQRFKELFVASIYLRWIENENKDKIIVVSVPLPLKEESYDVMVYATDKGSLKANKNGTVFLPKNTIRYPIQIKEKFDYLEYSKPSMLTLQEIDVEALKEAIKGYSELVLIYTRGFYHFDSEDFRNFLEQNKNVGIILKPIEQRIKLTYQKETKEIVFNKDKYNFLLVSWNGTMPITFDRPPFLVKHLRLP